MPTHRLPALLLSLLLPALVLGSGCESGLPGVPTDTCPDGKCDDPGADAGPSLPSGARIAPSTISLVPGEEIQFSVWLVDDNNQDMLSQAVPTFSVSSEIAIIEAGGLLRAAAAGETIVSATLEGYSVQAVVTVQGDELVEEPPAIDAALCCPGAVLGADDKNFCFLPPNTPGCPMTFADGYCDVDGDQNYSTPDANYPACESNGDGCNNSGWIQGYTDAMTICTDYNGEPAQAQAASTACCALTNDPNGRDDNICDVPPASSACAPTMPGGYCDPNGDGSYEDGNWVGGYNDYQALCGQ